MELLDKRLPGEYLRDVLAAQQHAIWAHWMRYLFSVSVANEDGSVTIPADKVARWQRQMETLYFDLPEDEQSSDRHQADKILSVLADLSFSVAPLAKG